MYGLGYYSAHFCTHFRESECMSAVCVCETMVGLISIAVAGCVVYKPQRRFITHFALLS